MNKSILIGTVLALGLTACAGSRTLYSEANPRLRGYSLTALTLPNPTAPNVFIVGDKIIVDQEPVRPVGQPGDPVTIFFALDQNGGYAFPQHGIEIVGHPNFCNPVSAYVFLCKYAHPPGDTNYKYVIRVRNESTGTALKDLDPTIWN